jgi:hypothetical protein
MRKLILAAAVVAAFGLASDASAGGYAGSDYSRDQCTYNKSANVLTCETTFTRSTPNATQLSFVADATCESGTRVLQRTGTLVETYRAWKLYSGHVPHAENELAGGNEAKIGQTWENFTDVDLGCLV